MSKLVAGLVPAVFLCFLVVVGLTRTGANTTAAEGFSASAKAFCREQCSAAESKRLQLESDELHLRRYEFFQLGVNLDDWAEARASQYEAALLAVKRYPFSTDAHLDTMLVEHPRFFDTRPERFCRKTGISTESAKCSAAAERAKSARGPDLDAYLASIKDWDDDDALRFAVAHPGLTARLAATLRRGNPSAPDAYRAAQWNLRLYLAKDSRSARS